MFKNWQGFSEDDSHGLEQVTNIGMANFNWTALGQSSSTSISIDLNSSNYRSQLDNVSMDQSIDYVFDRTDVRAVFITLYTIVFCCCFFGKSYFFNLYFNLKSIKSLNQYF